MRHPVKWLNVVIVVTMATSALAADADKKLEKVKEMFQPPYSEEDYYRADRLLTTATGTPYACIPNKCRQPWFVFGQDEWSLARHWILTAGLRYDHYSDFGGTLNPRLAFVWETCYDLTTKLLYGRAFRPPTIHELYVQNNPATIGNPDLDPETIQSLELVVDYQPVSRLRTIVNLFGYQADDLIEFVADPAGGKTAQNARDQEGYGFEFEMDWQIVDSLELRANCTETISIERREARIYADLLFTVRC